MNKRPSTMAADPRTRQTAHARGACTWCETIDHYPYNPSAYLLLKAARKLLVCTSDLACRWERHATSSSPQASPEQDALSHTQCLEVSCVKRMLRSGWRESYHPTKVPLVWFTHRSRLPKFLSEGGPRGSSRTGTSSACKQVSKGHNDSRLHSVHSGR